MKQNEIQSRIKIGKGMYAFDVPVRPELSRKMRVWQQARRDETARLLGEQRDPADVQSGTRSKAASSR